MSLSDAPGTPPSGSPPKSQASEQERWGTVFMGPDAARESRMDKVLNQQEQELWNRGTEIEYLRRVREKAAAEARSILDKAHADGEALRRDAGAWVRELKVQTEAAYDQARQEHARAEALYAEAEQIRARAQTEGRQAGAEAVRLELLAREERRDAAVSAVLHRIQEQAGVIFEDWRNELAALVIQAVQTGTGWVMSKEYAQGLEQLLTQSVQALESRQFFTAYVSPEDEELVRVLLGKAQDHLGLSRWAVLADPAVAPGGLRLESDSGRVEDYADARRAIVEEALSRMDVPASAYDAQAYDAVNAPLAELDVLPGFIAPPITPPVSPSASHVEHQALLATLPPEAFVPDVPKGAPPASDASTSESVLNADVLVGDQPDLPEYAAEILGEALTPDVSADGFAPNSEPDLEPSAHVEAEDPQADEIAAVGPSDAAFSLITGEAGEDVDAIVDLDAGELLPAVIPDAPNAELSEAELEADALATDEQRENGEPHA